MEFDGQQFDYVITVCDSARESCPVFFGRHKRLHHSFDDPAELNGAAGRTASAVPPCAGRAAGSIYAVPLSGAVIL